MILIIGSVLLIGGLVAFLFNGLVIRDNQIKLKPRTSGPRMAFLIPARDESKVIDGLLKSILEQTVRINPRDVYVIVEDEADPTVKICQRRGVRVLVRQDLARAKNPAARRRKGYALDDAVKQILGQGKHYDLYFVFDADNVASKDFVEKILEDYYRGYQMAIGYRHSKNANDDLIAAVSSLTFSMINILGNRKRVKHRANVIFSGTGCFVDGELVERWKGWPFHSLTEDYEMSLYAMLHGISTIYDERAVFYDEQPTRYRQTVAQRVRWIKGYFEARKIYVPEFSKMLRRRKTRPRNYGSLLREIIGVRPIIVMLVGVVLLAFDAIGKTISFYHSVHWVWLVVGLIGVVYLVLMFVTILMLKREKMRLKPGIKVRTVLFNPIYLLTYVYCALKALLSRDVGWAKIEHNRKTVEK